jgi:GNAT superfamily N-acetyltransferase
MIQQKGEIKIRKLVEADLIKVSEIVRLIREVEKRTFSFSFEPYWEINQPNVNFVAESDGEVVAFIVGKMNKGTGNQSDLQFTGTGVPYIPDDRIGWVDMNGTHPDHHHRGITKALMEAFYQECKKQNAIMRVVLYNHDEKLKRLMLDKGFKKFEVEIYDRE